MADLRALQNTPQSEVARLQQVPTPTPAPSGAASLANVGAIAAQGFGAASAAFAKVEKAEVEAGEQSFVATLTGNLIKAQQAGKTNPKFKTASEQRKIIQKAIADNPQYASLALKTFNTATGLDAAGLSNEEEQRIILQNEAWSANYGSPNASPEVNTAQFELYMSQKREAEELNLQTKRLANQEAQGKVDKLTVKNQTFKQINKLAFNEYESTRLDIESDLAAIQSGEKTVDQVRLEWAQAKINLGQVMNQFGELKNDPDAIAMMQPTFDLYDLAEKQFTGKFEAEELQRQIDISTKRAEASIVVNDPETTRAIVTSKLFGHTPGISTLMSKHASKILTQGPTDTRTFTPKDSTDFQLMIKGAIADPESTPEALTAQTNAINFFSRNGMDYSDQEKFNIAKALNTPEVWNKLTTEERQITIEAFESYMVDVVDNVIRDSMKQTISTTEFQGVTGFREAQTETATQPLSDFATLVVDETGIRYEIKPEANITRQLRTKVMSTNRELGEKVNPMISVLSGASGKTKEQVATDYLGVTLGTQEEVQTGDKQTSTQSQVDFKAEFIQAAIEDGSSEEEASELWDLVSAPATDTVNIGGKELTMEQAKRVLSTPARD